MKTFSSALTFLLLISSAQAYANSAEQPSSDYIPLNYNSAGLETKAQKAITDKEADYVENEYKDLDQDGVLDNVDLCPNTIFGVGVDTNGCELDSDKDGVFDRLDQCPDTAPGVKVNIFGCEGDEDNDGVVDSKDQCPGTPEGTPVDEVGCKLNNDIDKDGVINAEDQCPNTPAGATVNKQGCEPVDFVLANINFDTAKHDIRPDQVDTLKASAAALKNRKEDQNMADDEVILITGHTDWKSKQPYNLRLSWRRANSTKDFIVQELGHNPDDIYINGRGELEPIATNTTEEGRYQNRRIEFKVVKKSELPADATLTIPDEMTKY